jgi:hypothetical protein
MNLWFDHYADKIPALISLDRKFVECVTGRIPLLLRALFYFQDKPFNRLEFMKCEDISQVQTDVTEFFFQKTRELHTLLMGKIR